MKTVGIIAEYNPFHNGHLFHIKKAKELTGANYAVIVMSGNFVQRGAPAILDKYARAEMALRFGADLVLELPVRYACSSAEWFALGAVSILNRLGIIDSLCFGSESGEILPFYSAADLLSKEPALYKKYLSDFLKSGYSFPAARYHAILSYQKQTGQSLSFPPALLSSPNNILGIEYLKALSAFHSTIVPYTIQREGAGYHDLSSKAEYASAADLRFCILNHTDLSLRKHQIPSYVLHYLQKEAGKTYPIIEDDFSFPLSYQLCLEHKESLPFFSDISESLAFRLSRQLRTPLRLTERILLLKTRELTYTRISRAMFHILLRHLKEELHLYNQNGYAQYARILGLQKKASHLLRTAKQQGTLPLITKVADASLSLSPLGLKMLKEDIFASDLYRQAIYEKFRTLLPDEYTRNVLILDTETKSSE